MPSKWKKYLRTAFHIIYPAKVKIRPIALSISNRISGFSEVFVWKQLARSHYCLQSKRGKHSSKCVHSKKRCSGIVCLKRQSVHLPYYFGERIREIASLRRTNVGKRAYTDAHAWVFVFNSNWWYLCLPCEGTGNFTNWCSARIRLHVIK